MPLTAAEKKRAQRIRARDRGDCLVCCKVPAMDGRSKCAVCMKRSSAPSARKARYEGAGRKIVRPDFFDRAFNAFDGEGESPEGEGSDRLVLMADTTRCLCHPDRRRLTTVEMLEFFLDSPKGRANVWYSFGYDIMNVLYDLPFEKLRRLQSRGTVWYGEYRISYTPSKKFAIVYRPSKCKCNRGKNCKHKRVFLSHDVFGFFQSTFERTLDEWIPDLDEKRRAIIAAGKAARGKFHQWTMEQVRDYNATECSLLVDIMERFRDALRVAGLRVKSWAGAGALAQFWLGREKADRYFGTIPQEMEDARAKAFFGGRIDAGVIGTSQASEGDLQSAYPANVATLPDMSQLEWHKLPPHLARQRRNQRMPRLEHVRWKVPATTRWGPLPYREKDGTVKYPIEGRGWYHGVEVAAARKRFPGCIVTMEVWCAWGPLEYPFAQAVMRDYTLRKKYKDARAPANVPLKLALNSIYGKFAQRAGIKQNPKTGAIEYPRFHNLFYAGLITAGTRARLNDAIRAHGEENVLQIATDALFVKGKWQLVEPDALGSYEVDRKTEQITIAGAGMYETRGLSQLVDRKVVPGKVNKNKRRGFGGAPIDYDAVVRRFDRGGEYPITVNRFVTIGRACASEDSYAKRGTFQEEVRVMRSPQTDPFGGKRYREYDGRKVGGVELLPPGFADDPTIDSAAYQVFRPIDLRADDVVEDR